MTFEDSEGRWSKFTRDQFGNILDATSSSRYNYKYTRDSFGNVLTFEDSDGYWMKFTRDNSGNELTYENSDGFFGTFLAESEYRLYQLKDGSFKAGCQSFKTKEEALKHWNRDDERARIFTEALNKL